MDNSVTSGEIESISQTQVGLTFWHVSDESEVYVLAMCCRGSGGQFRKEEHIHNAVDVNNSNILVFVMKLLHFATDGDRNSIILNLEWLEGA